MYYVQIYYWLLLLSIVRNGCRDLRLNVEYFSQPSPAHDLLLCLDGRSLTAIS